MGAPSERIVVSAARTTNPKCPRCYRHTTEGRFNHEHLCDRCCEVILDKFPDHWFVPGIRAKFAECREMTPAERIAINAIDMNPRKDRPHD